MSSSAYAAQHATRLHKWMCDPAYLEFVEYLRMRLQGKLKTLREGSDEKEIFRAQGAAQELEAILGLKEKLHADVVTPPRASEK